MKYLFFFFTLINLAGSTALARTCSEEAVRRGCRTEHYDCNKPTHYTCSRCACPSEGSLDQNGLSFLETETIETEATTEGERCCLKRVCKGHPLEGRVCYEKRVCDNNRCPPAFNERGEKCCTKQVCRTIPKWGRECYERTVCGGSCK